MKKVVADQRARMLLADSSGDVRSAVDARLALASLAKPKEALHLLVEAVAKADSAYLLEMEAKARLRLAEQYERSGDHRKAYEEAMRLVTLGDERLSLQTMQAGAFTSHALSQAAAERDSLQRAWQHGIQEAEHARGIADARADRWMWTATGVAALGLIILVILLYRSNLAGKRTRGEIDGLRAEIAALSTAPKNRLREEPKEPIVPTEPVPTAVVTEARAPALDEQVFGFFLKKAPERLVTLRDARARSDHEKVARVVHSLRPQLTAIDPQLGELCTAIMAKDAAADPQRWNSDLDSLEAALERLLQ